MNTTPYFRNRELELARLGSGSPGPGSATPSKTSQLGCSCMKEFCWPSLKLVVQRNVHQKVELLCSRCIWGMATNQKLSLPGSLTFDLAWLGLTALTALNLSGLQRLLHLASPCFTLLHLASPCFTLLHLASPCFTLLHLASPCFTLLHLASPCFTWLHLAHLASPCFTAETWESFLAGSHGWRRGLQAAKSMACDRSCELGARVCHRRIMQSKAHAAFSSAHPDGCHECRMRMAGADRARCKALRAVMIEERTECFHVPGS